MNKNNMDFPKWQNDKKTAISFEYNNETYNLQENDVILFKFLHYRDINHKIKKQKGKIIGFGWSHQSPPHYIIVNIWDPEKSKWSSKRGTIKIPNWETGRATNGEIIL